MYLPGIYTLCMALTNVYNRRVAIMNMAFCICVLFYVHPSHTQWWCLAFSVRPPAGFSSTQIARVALRHHHSEELNGHVYELVKQRTRCRITFLSTATLKGLAEAVRRCTDPKEDHLLTRDLPARNISSKCPIIKHVGALVLYDAHQDNRGWHT